MPVVVGWMSGGQDDAGQCSRGVEVGARTRGRNGAASVDVLRYLGSADLGSDQDRVSFLVSPRCPQLGERTAGRDGSLQPVVDVLDDGTPVLIFAFPADGPRVDPGGLVRVGDRGEHPHEGPGTRERYEQLRTVPSVRQQVLEQVRTPRRLGPSLVVRHHVDPVGGVGKPDSPVGTFDVYLGLLLDRCAQTEGAGHLLPGSRANSHHRRVVTVDPIGPIEIGLHDVDVGHCPAVHDGQCGRHGMGQRIGDHPVDNGTAAQTSTARPGGAAPIADGSRPRAQRADPAHRADTELDPPGASPGRASQGSGSRPE